jgi:3-hydroxyacyl-[acyl-carrier-protein] dehydratase
MSGNFQHILELLPYEQPFLFVDELLNVDDDGAHGAYTFKINESFYDGHFKNHPVTPGVILTECMGQIGLVCLGIYLLQNEIEFKQSQIALSSTDINFLKPVFPEERVEVFSIKEYFRFNKLKCRIHMKNSLNEIVCEGSISGMIIPSKNEK